MSTPKEYVLVVEDDAPLREALVDTLQAAGLSALAAGEAHSALELLESQDIVLVISDVQMPGPNGYQLLASIKALRPELPVVLMTAYGTVAQAVAAMREGATDYIVKPFDAQALIEMARRQLAMRVMPNELGRRRSRVEAIGVPGAQDRGKRCHGAHHRRERHRQGSLCAVHPRTFGARRRALRGDQLRGDSGEHARGHAVRLREGRLHGRARRPRRQVRAGAGRHLAARRNFGNGFGVAGENTARAAGA